MITSVYRVVTAAFLFASALPALRADGVDQAVPKLTRAPRITMKIGGALGARLHANLENWELRVPDADPALTEMFRDRERSPSRNLLPWSGEFVGKYLNASILSYRILRDPRQKAMIDRVVHALLESQGSDGYLGPFDKQDRLTGKNWDVWGHYWVIRALLLFYEEFGSQEALTASMRAANLIAGTFLNRESLHDFQGMLDMYYLTGEEPFQKVFTHIWYSILRGDRHNTGGFSSGEHSTGNPYDPEAIETCSTVAWTDMSVDMLKLTGNSLVADELELSLWNGLLGGQNPAGNWWTYNTPMDGTKEAAAHTIHFQCRPGSPDLNCCSVNGPRGMALVSEWAVLTAPGSVILNYYGPSAFDLDTPGGQRMTIEQTTDYPAAGEIAIHLGLARPERFELQLRVPAWSARTRLLVNGSAAGSVTPGTYLDLRQQWNPGDVIQISLDMSPHYWAGEREEYGKVSIYRGPLLLAFDPIYNPADAEHIPEMDARRLRLIPDATDRVIRPWVLVQVTEDGLPPVRLCDFATAGAYGNPYVTWLPIRNVAPIPFDRSHPVWANFSVK